MEVYQIENGFKTAQVDNVSAKQNNVDEKKQKILACKRRFWIYMQRFCQILFYLAILVRIHYDSCIDDKI